MRVITVLFLLGIVSIIMYFYSQLIGNYFLSFTSIIVYTISISIIIFTKNINIFIIQTLLFGSTLWAVYYIILGPNWILANGDLINMNKVAEEIVVSGHYPFNNQSLIVVRPNYVQYPMPFMLQAILSIVTSINVTILMYIPIIMYSLFILIVVIVSLLIKYSSKDILPLTIIPAISFITPYPIYFIYSHVSRTLLFLVAFVLFIESRKVKSYYTRSILTVILSTSAIVGHSQEPIVFSIFYIIFLLSLLILTIHQKNVIQTSNYIKQITIFILLVFSYNIYVSITTSSGVFNLLRSMLTRLFVESSIETAIAKTSVAQSLLIKEEFIVMLIGFVIMMGFVLIQLLNYGVRSFKNKDNKSLAWNISIFLYSIIALIPFLMPGIGTDLYWRSLWCLFVAISIWTVMTSQQKNTDVAETNGTYLHYQFKKFKIIIIMITLILYILAVNIYLRVHLTSSSVYTHEASTINMLIDSSLIKYLQISNINNSNITIIDTPDQPAYEIARALNYLNPNISPCTITLDPEIKYYINIRYLNGLPKIRQLSDKDTCTNLNLLNSTMIIISSSYIQFYKSLLSKNVIFSLNDITFLK
jgi:hypothetical protein